MRRFEIISEEQWNEDTRDLLFVDVERPYDNITLPRRATSKSAGYDIYSPMDVSLLPGDQFMIPTGIKASMEDDDVLLIIIRSSLGIKKGISVANGTGVIDADYYNNEDNEGHIWVALKNNSGTQFDIHTGDRIAQAIFVKYNIVDNDEPINDIRDGGLGSTS